MIEQLVEALKSDPEYRRGWNDNIAMAFKDEFSRRMRELGISDVLPVAEVHDIANNAASNFLDLLCREPESE